MEFFTNLFGWGNNGLASKYGGIGEYATYTGTDGSKIGLNKDAYNAAISNGSIDGLSKGFENSGGFGAGLADFLSSDYLKGAGTIAGIGSDIFNIMNSRKALKQAERAWEAENARANEIMAMNREKYNTYKADKARLNSQYVG